MYSDTRVFKAAFDLTKDEHDVCRTLLSESLASFRKRVGDLIATVPAEVPGLTVHDLTHMDALWEMLDILVDGSYPLNPAEVYVLGGAILLHDSAMTIHAYKGGLQEVKECAEYTDALSYFQSNTNLDVGCSEYELASQKYATSAALRLKHAEQAEALATQDWADKFSGDARYLIENSELREHYAYSIGLIAHSHNWNISQLIKKLSESKGAFTSFPNAWSVNELKLALILRCIDAMHIDDRRAPSFTSSIRYIGPESLIHWEFQNKLAKPSFDAESQKLVYTSKSPFTVDKAPAWNLCFDTIQMIDKELRDSGDTLQQLGLPPFKVTGVVGVRSPDSLSNYVQVSGWTPLPLNLSVSDVPSLAKTLGGKDLYNYPLTPLRELIQNAADAIEARSVLEDDFELLADGKITIKINELDEEIILEVLDNGIGMSERVLTKALLDFGLSFWKSSAARSEFPGLQKFTNKLRGRYGIGFFSVFMWSNNVTVSSRRYQDGQGDAKTLDFQDGMDSRPILREAQDKEKSTKWSSAVRLIIDKKEFYKTVSQDFNRPNRKFVKSKFNSVLVGGDLAKKLKEMCGILPIRVVLQEGENEAVTVSLPDWKTCSNEKFINFFEGTLFILNEYEKHYIDSLTTIKKDGQVTGRVFLTPYEGEMLKIAVYEKGIFVNTVSENKLSGVIESCTTNAARDRLPDLNHYSGEWLEEIGQKSLALSKNLGETLSIQSLLLEKGQGSDDHPQFILNREIMSFNQVKEVLKFSKKFNVTLEVQDHSGGLAWSKSDSLDVLTGLDVDEFRLHTIVGRKYSKQYMGYFDSSLQAEDTSQMMKEFIVNSDNSLAKVLNKLAICCGDDFQVHAGYIEKRATYSKDEVSLDISAK